uniref:Uncharacterized protein n=1 Tax=Clandestinovirus TaxID=2831644 RepID=A0A8F8KKM5_9VIRU|nr:hypothetical protein KOM_12_118 [Clandestinovirus]
MAKDYLAYVISLRNKLFVFNIASYEPIVAKMSIVDKFLAVRPDNLNLSGEELAYFVEVNRHVQGVRKKWKLGQIDIERLREMVHADLCNIFCSPDGWRRRLGPKNQHNKSSINVLAGNILRPLLGSRAASFRDYILAIPTLNDLYWMNAVASRVFETDLFLQPEFWARKFIMDSKAGQTIEDIEPRVKNVLGEELDHKRGPVKMRVFAGESIAGFWDELGTRCKRITKWENVYWLIYFDNWVSTVLQQWWASQSCELARSDRTVFEYEPQWIDRLPVGMKATWKECCDYFAQYISSTTTEIPDFWKVFVMKMGDVYQPENDEPVNAVVIAKYIWLVMHRLMNSLKRPIIVLPQLFNHDPFANPSNKTLIAKQCY